MTVFFLQAFCEPGNVQENGILAFAKHVLFPVLDGTGEAVDAKCDVMSSKIKLVQI